MYDLFFPFSVALPLLRASRGGWYHRSLDSPGAFSDYLIGVFDREGNTNPGPVIRD